MRKVVVLASMAQELAFADKYKKAKQQRHGVFDYTEYLAETFELITCVCGTGKVSGALCAQSAIEAYKPDLIISVGTSGALCGSELLSVVVATECVQHDFDTSPFSGRRGQLSELGITAMKADEKFLEAAREYSYGKQGIKFGRILSGDSVVVESAVKERLHSEFGGLCVEMEAGGIAQTCVMYGVGFAAVKGISDSDSDHEKQFRENMTKVAVNTADVVLGTLKALAKKGIL